MPSLADIKAQGRQRIHDRAAVSCLLVDDDHPLGLIFADDDETQLTVRYLTKLDTTGGLDSDYGQVIDGIDRLIFNDSNVAEVSAALVDNGEAPLVLSRAAKVTIPEYKGLAFTLDSQEPPDGPSEIAWTVARTRA